MGKNNQKLTTQEFINRANSIHNHKYDYSKTNYEKTDKKVCVICHEKDKFGDEHGEFYVTPHSHIGVMHSGCPKCSGKFRKDTQYFIKESRLIYGDKYDYSKTNYISALKKVEIICPKHGSFCVTPNDHLNGKSCKKCGYESVSEKLSMSTEEFISKAKNIHGEKYNYSKVNYINYKSKIRIICPIHGDFYQSAITHLRGCGCPKCKQSHLENEIMGMLEKNEMAYEPQKKFEWLEKKSLDFYLPNYNVAIECQGKQHFMDTLYGKFEDNYNNDKQKKKLCEEHGVKLLYYSNLGIEYPYQVFENKEELLKEIINEKN